jgi:hypothetical protein
MCSAQIWQAPYEPSADTIRRLRTRAEYERLVCKSKPPGVPPSQQYLQNLRERGTPLVAPARHPYGVDIQNGIACQGASWPPTRNENLLEVQKRARCVRSS